ncbi:glycosyltransferase family 4 protein [Mucilaginibacter sp. HMF5004]|uniref:glycosyltransferase family 4 protein n=1 Tax=Mucilaginibacter rivuli TaxID=2857527 RepID=UPI001C5D15C8|nr:glycosyltransferase family 4 protein [Mucilaginibacter rivuli]MBW4890159.1 glycosyltransferase family 4 protein [Mucilaginibacter rivuli]
MKIGISGPAFFPMLQPWLHPDQKVDVKGTGGTPVNHQIIALLERGYEVHLFTVTPEILPGDSRTWHGDKLHIYAGPFRRRARHRTPDLYKNEREFLKAKMLEIMPDIIHAHWQYEFGWAALDSKIPTLLTCHDAPLKVLGAQTDLYRAIRLVVAAITLKKAKYLTGVSPYTAIGQRFFTKVPVTVIPNFEPDNIFALYKPGRVISDNINIAMINNGFHGRKNVAKGILAFNEFKKSHPTAVLNLYGADNTENGDAGKWCRDNNISGNINFHGEMPFADVINALSQADIFLHTSLEESCPMVLIEAMAMGIPVVAGEKAGGIPWMLEDGGGALTDITSAQKINSSLLEIVKPGQYAKASADARRVALERFSKEVVINKYLKFYERILSENS